MTNATQEQVTPDTEGETMSNDDRDHCGYVYETAEGMRCGGLRGYHRLLKKGHDFVEPPVAIAKHPYEPLYADEAGKEK